MYRLVTLNPTLVVIIIAYLFEGRQIFSSFMWGQQLLPYFKRVTENSDEFDQSRAWLKPYMLCTKHWKIHNRTCLKRTRFNVETCLKRTKDFAPKYQFTKNSLSKVDTCLKRTNTLVLKVSALNSFHHKYLASSVLVALILI